MMFIIKVTQVPLKADLHGTTLSHTTSLQQAYYIVSCKSNLHLAYDCRLGPKSCRKLVVCDKVVPCKSAFTLSVTLLIRKTC